MQGATCSARIVTQTIQTSGARHGVCGIYQRCRVDL